MSSISKFYRYEGYSYRVEEDSEGRPSGAHILQLDGSWVPITWGWQVIIENNLPITEEQAFMLAGIKKLNDSSLNIVPQEISAQGIPAPEVSAPNIAATDISTPSIDSPKISDSKTISEDQK